MILKSSDNTVYLIGVKETQSYLEVGLIYLEGNTQFVTVEGDGQRYKVNLTDAVLTNTTILTGANATFEYEKF